MTPYDSVSTASTAPNQDLPTSDALIDIAAAFFSEGFVGLAGSLATLAAQHGAAADAVADIERRSSQARATDAAAGRITTRHDEFLVPSIERAADGSPTFFLPIPAEASGQAEVMQVIAQEVQGDGVDAELRSFLSAMIEPGDAYIDCDPGFGLSLLSAATRHPNAVRVISRAADADHAAFLQRAFDANGLTHVSIVPPAGERPQSLDVLLRHPLASQAERLIIHAGLADDVVLMTAELATAARHPRVAALVWSLGSDAATTQVTDALSALGTHHFVIAADADGAVLVPQHAVEGASVIISLTPTALGERQAA